MNESSFKVRKLSKSFLSTLRDIAILWLIDKKPSHGYEIMKQLFEIAPYGLSISESRLYPGLSSLKNKGCLKSELDISISNKRPRKVYTITEKGRDYLKTEVTDVYLIVKFLETFLKGVKDDMEKSDTT